MYVFGTMSDGDLVLLKEIHAGDRLGRRINCTKIFRNIGVVRGWEKFKSLIEGRVPTAYSPCA